MYVTLFVFSDSKVYDNYRICFAYIDTLLLIFSIFSLAYFRQYWTIESYITLSTVIVLNILNEIDIRYPIEIYHTIYKGVIINHFILMIIFLKIKKNNNDNMGTALV